MSHSGIVNITVCGMPRQANDGAEEKYRHKFLTVLRPVHECHCRSSGDLRAREEFLRFHTVPVAEQENGKL